jgi:signal transduction histidine kinase
LPPDILNAILALLDGPGGSYRTRTLIAEFNGEPWIFGVSRITPVDGIPEDIVPERLPRQIHGYKLTQDRLSQIGQNIVEGDLSLAENALPGQASLPLIDYSGKVISRIVWTPPRPGASILRKAAVPLMLALSVASAISAVSSLYTVRSARRLERALFAAKAADRSKTEFLSNVSHELRTPMNGVLGAAQLLETTDLDTEQQEFVAVLMSSAKAQLSLISDLIDFSRMEAGRHKVVSENFHPAAVLKEVTDMMQVAAARKRVKIETDWSGLEDLTLRGDAQAFRQVLTNLVGNAVKFTDKGSVQVRATLDEHAERARLAVSVTDTGPGIPEDALPRIFERFYQVDGSLTRSSEGTGLGLAISQKLAQMMGGDITVSSQLGLGSTFDFTANFDRLAWPPDARDAA